MADDSAQTQIADQMQTQGMSTTDIIKSLSSVRNDNSLSISNAAAALIDITDMLMAQTKSKVQQANDSSNDGVMKMLADTGELAQLVTERAAKIKKGGKGVFSEITVERFNDLINDTNNNSGKLWDLAQTVEQSIGNKNATQTELLTLSSNGSISGAELIGKLREQKDTVKKESGTIQVQADDLADKQKQAERPAERLHRAVITDALSSKIPITKTAAIDNQAPAAEAEEPTAEKRSTSRGGGGGGRR